MKRILLFTGMSLISIAFCFCEKPVTEQTTVQISSTKTTSSSSFGSLWPGSTMASLYGSGSETSSESWTSYLGGTKLDEAEFYRLSGDEKTRISVLETRRSIKENNDAWSILGVSGVILGGAGVGIQVYGYSTPDGLSNGTVLTGLAIMGSGCLAVLVAAVNTKHEPTNYTPASYAMKLADQYNLR